MPAIAAPATNEPINAYSIAVAACRSARSLARSNASAVHISHCRLVPLDTSGTVANSTDDYAMPGWAAKRLKTRGLSVIDEKAA